MAKMGVFTLERALKTGIKAADVLEEPQWKTVAEQLALKIAGHMMASDDSK